MNWNMPASFRCVPAIALAVIATGCSISLSVPTASNSPDVVDELGSSAGVGPPTAGGSGGFYPLQIGNHWQHRWEFTSNVHPGDGDVTPPYHEERTFDRRLICTEPRDGRDYIVEELREVDSPYASWYRYRQDRSGLYEADFWFEPPACLVEVGAAQDPRAGNAEAALARGMAQIIPAGSTTEREAYQAAAERLRERLAMVDRAVTSLQFPGGGAAEGELKRLEYPLRAGARWTIVNSPSGTPRRPSAFTAIVEGADVLNLEAGRLRGYRIRVQSDFNGPNDRVHVWYGPSGFLQAVSHLEDLVVDPFGRPMARVSVDTRESLVRVNLVGSGVTFEPIGLGRDPTVDNPEGLPR